ncbi:hypothetical protein KP509_18G071600 [Ceratopteris richardii]|uniref:Cyclin N-terminal domain-containing protein n=1 Tax=Ceratopteris richardii TaxID=49495 RepID=A0A8T2SSZ9_CERRI|nr:hypothetical protein KP509_18G071600 [Ceratopteris richardii]
MYETRHQAAAQNDENRHIAVDAEMKAGAKVSMAAANAKTGVNTRRALGDIGNVVADRQSNNHEGQQGAKKALPQVDRPITRSFGAQLASKKALQEASGQVTKLDPQGNDLQEGHPARMKALIGNQNGKAGAVLKERRGRTLTATLTARSEAACAEEKEEVLKLPSIDAADVNDQLAVVDYIEDIYSFYRKTEAKSCVPPDYMSRQTTINHNMRAILVDWLIEVHLKFKLMPETLFLTTNVMDRYLAVRSVERKNLQLVGMTALLIASKYEEIWAPEIQDLIYISDKTYTREQILQMEKTMLNVLAFELCVPTPYVFIVRFLKAAGSDLKMDMLAFYYVELCLVDYAMIRYSPSMLAAASVYTAQRTLRPNDASWTKLLKYHSGYSESDLVECAAKIVSLHEKAKEGDLTVVNRKYSLEKFGSVARLEAPSLTRKVEPCQ